MRRISAVRVLFLLSVLTGIGIFGTCPAVHADGATAATAALGTAATGVAPITVAVAPDLYIKDVFGRIITAADLNGWIVLYGFGNEDNADKAVGWIRELSLAYPNVEGVLYVLVADASGYTKVLQPFVRKVLKREYKKNMQDIKARLTEKGIKLNYALEDRCVLIADSKADFFNAFGIGDQRNLPHMIFVDANRKVRAHFTEYSDEVPKTLGKLLEERKSKQSPIMTALKMSHKKKSMVARYAILGGLLWLLLK